MGDPGFGYPWPWAVSRWLDGEVATVEALADSSRAAIELAQFLAALRRFAPEDIPAENTRADLTGRPLPDRDPPTAGRHRRGPPRVPHRSPGSSLSPVVW
ncbi:phosphotransferase [Streptomyces sp. MK37H]|uniref:phosphotransferase n=1 Tax=Streptomyces sp. MK37H TaxID=2699117 RepID=UPI0035A93539